MHIPQTVTTNFAKAWSKVNSDLVFLLLSGSTRRAPSGVRSIFSTTRVCCELWLYESSSGASWTSLKCREHPVKVCVFFLGLYQPSTHIQSKTHSDLLGTKSPVFKLFHRNLLDVCLAQVIQMWSWSALSLDFLLMQLAFTILVPTGKNKRLSLY